MAIAAYLQSTENPVLQFLRNSEGGYTVWRSKSYDFNVFTLKKTLEKLAYMHNNPVLRVRGHRGSAEQIVLLGLSKQ